jgi:hypothetical protein
MPTFALLALPCLTLYIMDLPGSKGRQVSMVANPSYQTDQTWHADPSYFQYVGCKCLGVSFVLA